jgi:hypothetical protein
MNRILSIALLVGGVALIGYGAAANDSAASTFARFFTGNPTDRSMWLLIGGAVAAVVGLAGLIRGVRP